MFHLGELYNAYVQDPHEVLGHTSTDTDVLDCLALDPFALTSDTHFSALLALLNAPTERVVDTVQDGLLRCVNEANQRFNDQNLAGFNETREPIEKYLFCAHVILGVSDGRLSELFEHHNRQERQKKQTSTLAEANALVGLLCRLVYAISVAAALDLRTTASEREILAQLYLRPLFRLLEQEQLAKTASLAEGVLDVVAAAVEHQQQEQLVRVMATQYISYYEHIGPLMAHLCARLYVGGDMNVVTGILNELSAREWDDNDTKGPKYVGQFVSCLSGLNSALATSLLPYILLFFESPAANIRTNVLAALETVMGHLSERDDGKDALDSIITVVASHINDTSHFCRARAVNILCTQIERGGLSVAHRQQFLDIAAIKISDKAQTVRHKAFRLLRMLLTTHPFSMGNGLLVLSEWQDRLEILEKEIENAEVAANELNDDPNAERLSTEQVQKLEQMATFHKHAIDFIAVIEKSLEVAELLLWSKSKSDIIDAMDVLVIADTFGIAAAQAGIRKMVHLVWVKANNDEKDTVRDAVVRFYASLFLEDPDTEDVPGLYVAKRLVSLTCDRTTGELTSLERLLGCAHELGYIDSRVVARLWDMYQTVNKSVTRKLRRGAAIVLGMLAAADSSVVHGKQDVLTNIGFGALARQDLSLARYTCVIVRYSVSEKDWQAPHLPTRLVTAEASIFQRMSHLLRQPATSMEWFGFAQEAFIAINDICERPDLVFGTIIQSLTSSVFEEDDSHTEQERQTLFAQLIFLAGEAAIKLLVHFERCEQIFKRAYQHGEQANAEKESNKNKDGPEDMDMVTASNAVEEDFTDYMKETRERELLFSDHTILAKFAPLVVDLCKDELRSPHDEMMSIAATTTLVKFMCVSRRYCEANMPLLVSLSTSKNPVVRSNLVVGMGDLAVCFNHIVDEYTEFLYEQLSDEFAVVRRTSIVTLTFLILAGQFKVKGRIGAMAKSLESPDTKISQLAHMFFNELASKENAMYNNFMDIVLGLSQDPDLSDVAVLQRIIKFLAQYIDKEKHVKSLVDRLSERLTRASSQQQWNCLSAAITSLPGKREDAVVALLAEGFKDLSVMEA